MTNGVVGTLLIYTHAMAGGGAERVCAILASGFARRGARVVLVVDQARDDNAGYLDSRVEMVVLGRGHLGSIWQLAQLVRQHKPDVSLSALSASNVKHAIAAALAGRLSRAILSYHAFASGERQLLSRVGYWAIPLLSRLAARTVAVSHSLKADLVAHWGASAVRTVAIHNPVAVGSDVSHAARCAEARPLILAAGRLVPAKNMHGILEAFAIVRRTIDADLVILGEGPERARLLRDAARLGCADRVHLAGYVAEPWASYRQAACFVTASMTESFSMVVAEALTYGLPVVASDSAGPREVLDDGAYGRLTVPNDPADMAEAIVAALQNPGNSAPRRARAALFSVAAGLDAYAALFATVVAEAR